MQSFYDEVSIESVIEKIWNFVWANIHYQLKHKHQFLYQG